MPPSPFPLSVVILARNEAPNIERCVRSAAWCDQVVVVDDDSTDGTAELARACGAHVVQHGFLSFAAQRNWALEHAGLRHEWVLMLDADEVLTDGLRDELMRTLPSAGSMVAYRMCRKTIFMGRWLKYSDGFPVWIMRLVRRGKATFQDSGHGEVPVPDVEGEVGTIREPFLHYPFSKGIGDWIDRHNRYASREAKLEFADRALGRWRDLFARDRAQRRRALRQLSRRLPGRPVLRFGYQYFAKLGCLDGRAGLVFSLLMAWYEGLIVLKRRELEEGDRREEEGVVE
jgi:glycosyltransferase involved in cell wall biosynthesis